MTTLTTAPSTPAPPAVGNIDEGEPRFTRLSVNVALDIAEALRSLTRRKGITATEGVRRAIAVWKLVEDASAAGQQLQLVDRKTGAVRELMLL